MRHSLHALALLLPAASTIAAASARFEPHETKPPPPLAIAEVPSTGGVDVPHLKLETGDDGDIDGEIGDRRAGAGWPVNAAGRAAVGPPPGPPLAQLAGGRAGGIIGTIASAGGPGPANSGADKEAATSSTFRARTDGREDAPGAGKIFDVTKCGAAVTSDPCPP
jgi:hypothetical protein